MEKSKKAINFDLDDKALKAAYPKKSYKAAWADIKKFMLDNGFEHRQYSGYNSKKPLFEFEVEKILSDMKSELPWLAEKDVVKQIDVTDIGETLSYNHIFEKPKNQKLQNIAKKAKDVIEL